MGTFKLQVPTRLMFTQILEGALGRRLLSLNTPWSNPRLVDTSFEARRRDTEILREFRANLRRTEDMIGKLDFGLREIFRNH